MGRLRVKVVLTNAQAILLKPYPLDSMIKYWSFSHPQWFHMRSKWAFRYHGQTRYRWDGKVRFLKRDRVPAGLFWATKKEIESKENIKFKIIRKVERPKLRKLDKWINSTGEYSFQNTCANKVASRISKYGKGGLIVNATGSGKTRIAAMIASRLDTDFLFVVDQLDLLEQARKDIGKHLGEKIGKVGESKFKLKRFTVATRQTLAGHIKDPVFKLWYERVGVIFIDEIHEQMNKSNFDVIKSAKPMAVIGLTATLGLTKKPVRMKAYSLTGPVLFTYPLQQGMEEGVLSHGIAIQFLYNNSIKERNAYTPQEAYDLKIVNNGERDWLISRIVRRANKLGKYIIVLVERLKHLDHLSKRLELYDVPHIVVAGSFRGKKIKVSRRYKAKDKFEKGKIRVILANKVFKKGVDIKRVDFIIDAAGRQSANDAIQKFGRGIRRHADKEGLVYIDISDYDDYDVDRKKKNWLAVAAKRRRRALRKAGIKVYRYDSEQGIKGLFKNADKWLRKELRR